jgi:hypothetical protein
VSAARHTADACPPATQDNPKAYLSGCIRRTTSLSRILRLLKQDPEIVNHIHLTAALLKLAATVRGRPWSTSAKALGDHVAAQLLHHQPLASLSTEDLSLLLHALAKSGCSDRPLLTSICAILRAQPPGRLSGASTKQLSNAAWALAKLQHHDAELLRRIAEAAAPRVGEFTIQGLATLCWAFATLDYWDARLQDLITDALLTNSLRPLPQHVSMLAWAAATMRQSDRGLFSYLVDQASAQLLEFNVQGICNLSWALHRAGFDPPDLFRSMASQLASHLPAAFTFQDVLYAATTFRHHYYRPLYDALAAACVRQPHLSLEQVAALVDAFAAVPHYNADAFAGFGRRVVELQDRLSLELAAKLMRGFGGVRHDDPELWAALLHAAAGHDACPMPERAAADMLWGIAVSGAGGQQGMRASLAACERLLRASPGVVEHCAEHVGDGFWLALASYRLLVRRAGGSDEGLASQLLGSLDALLAMHRRAPRRAAAGGRQDATGAQQRLCAALVQLGLAPVTGAVEAEGLVCVDVAVQYRGMRVAVMLPRAAAVGKLIGTWHLQQQLLQDCGWTVVVVQPEEMDGMCTHEQCIAWLSAQLLELAAG